MGLLFLAVTAGLAYHVRPWKWSHLLGARRTQGRVVGFVRISSTGEEIVADGIHIPPNKVSTTESGFVDDSVPSVHPRVRYEVGGKTFEIRGMGNTGYHVGDVVNVTFPPDHPDDGMIDRFLEQWAPVLVFGLGGSVFAVIGLGILRAHRS
jgi:hypothetical protein